MLSEYVRKYGGGMSFEDITESARCVPPGSDGLLALSASRRRKGGDAFHGVSPRHGHGHFSRALMELTAATIWDLRDTLFGEEAVSRVILTGGGAANDVWCQMIADMLNTDILVSSFEEPACAGAAMLAGTGAGWFNDVTSAQKAWVRPRRTFSPETDIHIKYEEWRRDRDRQSKDSS